MTDKRRRKHRSGRARKPRPPRKPDSEAIVEIESLAAGGDGVGRLEDGRIAFVRWTSPGDRVRIAFADDGGRFVRARLEEVVEAGDARVEPRCAVFGRCGGCAWQHVDYTAQIAAKESILREALRRIGRLDPLPEFRFVASPEAYRYRSRARLQIQKGRVGYRRWHDHQIEPVESCPILAEPLDLALGNLSRQLASEDSLPDVREGQEWEISLGAGDKVRSGPVRGPRERGRQAIPTRGFELAVGEDLVTISHGGFFQANYLLRDALGDALFAGLEGAGTGLVLELYSGAGYFTLGLARRFDEVIAVESDATALVDMERNLRRAEVSNVKVHAGLVEEVIPKLTRWRPDAVVLDPPRSGLATGAAEGLAALGARRILYVSCDPATLARDLALLVARGYYVDEITGFDLFPQTPHVEALAVLNREDDEL